MFSAIRDNATHGYFPKGLLMTKQVTIVERGKNFLDLYFTEKVLSFEI